MPPVPARSGYPAAMRVDPHPLLHVASFLTRFPAPLAALTSPPELLAGLKPGAPAPLSPPDDTLRAAIRDMLRYGGFKPTGRSKPASEYLIKAAADGFLGPINPAVDACNVVSLHSGFPISVVDLDRTSGALHVGLAPDDATYVFNTSGQTIDIGRLLCLFDAEGPCANAVKDAQRTKTGPDTRITVSVVWGTNTCAGRVGEATRWYRSLLAGMGAETEEG
jgi:DNA/RNA-binding domain of Phe-tRNA-synthetase-like protein